jgi:S1-C subfamily serine protease
MKHLLRPEMTQKVEAVRVTPLWGIALSGVLMAASVPGNQVLAQGRTMSEMVSSSSLLLLHSRSQGFLGVDVGDIDQDHVQPLHLKDTHGAEITVLDHDAPAGKVGLKLHDVILEVNGQGIDNAEHMKQLLHDTPPGRRLQLLVSRDGLKLYVAVQLADRRKVQQEARERLDSFGASSVTANSFVSNGADLPSNGGFHSPFAANSLHVGTIVEPLSPQMSDFLGVSAGVMIKSVARKSSADAAGLRAHDVVLEVAGEAVVTTSDWERLLRTAEGKPVQVEILRDRVKQLVLLQVDGKRHKP